ncbi:MAG: hypothetical protein LC804_11190 [Acidobacteria bacterium]|nr:hypothetical protein [Acidobacteriota bacterium]
MTKRFASVVVLEEASFVVQPGSIFGLLGANGAGNTSRIYSASVLMYGQRVGIRTVLRATRVGR